MSRATGPPVHDDLVDRDCTAARPTERWVGDITEPRTRTGNLHLCSFKNFESLRVSCVLSSHQTQGDSIAASSSTREPVAAVPTREVARVTGAPILLPFATPDQAWTVLESRLIGHQRRRAEFVAHAATTGADVQGDVGLREFCVIADMMFEQLDDLALTRTPPPWTGLQPYDSPLLTDAQRWLIDVLADRMGRVCLERVPNAHWEIDRDDDEANTYMCDVIAGMKHPMAVQQMARVSVFKKRQGNGSFETLPDALDYGIRWRTAR